jgi:hypothetical protein
MDATDAAEVPSQQLAMQLIGDFSDFDEGFLLQIELDRKLFNIVSPFASSSTTYDLHLGFSDNAIVTSETLTSVPEEEQVAA